METVEDFGCRSSEENIPFVLGEIILFQIMMCHPVGVLQPASEFPLMGGQPASEIYPEVGDVSVECQSYPNRDATADRHFNLQSSACNLMI